MSKEQTIKMIVPGFIVCIMLFVIGENEILKWMIIVAGLTMLAFGIAGYLKAEEKE